MVAAIGSLYVGLSTILIACLIGFWCGFDITALMSLTVFWIIYLNRPIYPILMGGFIVLPGLAALAL